MNHRASAPFVIHRRLQLYSSCDGIFGDRSFFFFIFYQKGFNINGKENLNLKQLLRFSLTTQVGMADALQDRQRPGRPMSSVQG